MLNSPSKNKNLLPDMPFSEGAKSPKLMQKIDKNNFVKAEGANRSIYDIFRRSKDRLFLENPKRKLVHSELNSPIDDFRKRRKVDHLSKDIQKPQIGHSYNAEESSVFQAFKRNNMKTKLPAVAK
jgi:hypothetical protein